MTRSVTGSVTLTGVLWDAAGVMTGTRAVANADGIRVYLVRSSAIADSALTIGGSYRLTGPQGSGYQVRARMGPSLSVSSASFSIGSADVAVAQALPLPSTGNVTVSPNPFTTRTTARFTVATAGSYGLNVFSLANLRVAPLVVGSGVPSETHSVTWDGTDGASQALADGAYWIAFSGAGEEWAELVFKGP